MKLYTYAPAPSPRRVHMLLKEKGIDVPMQSIDMAVGEHLGNDYAQINPRKTVPALQLDDGTLISEVTAICQYLDQVYPDKSLFGSSPTQRALIVEWDHRIEFEGMSAFAEVFRNRSKGFKGRALPGPLDVEQIPELVDRGSHRLKAFFETLDKQLQDNAFVAGEQFSMADISAYVTITTCQWIKVTVPPQLAALTDWMQRVAARPSAQ